MKEVAYDICFFDLRFPCNYTSMFSPACSPVLSWMSEGYVLRVAPCLAGPYFSDVTDVTFPTSADADVRLLTSADADLHNPKQNSCVTIEFSEI